MECIAVAARDIQATMFVTLEFVGGKFVHEHNHVLETT